MAGNTPFDQLAGIRLVIYVAPVGSTVPAVTATPTSPWVEMGATEGEQSMEHGGDLTFFYDNSHQGAVKSVRPQEDPMYHFTLVGLTLENYAQILDRVADVVTVSNTKKLPIKRGSIPEEYAVLCRATALSPYGAYPGMYVVPRGVFQGEPQPTFSKDGRASLEVVIHALEDDTQADADRLGWLIVQTS